MDNARRRRDESPLRRGAGRPHPRNDELAARRVEEGDRGRHAAELRGADLAELLRSRLAEQGHSGDAHNGDQRDQQGVLHEAGAPLALDAGLEPLSEKGVLGHHGWDFLQSQRPPTREGFGVTQPSTS